MKTDRKLCSRTRPGPLARRRIPPNKKSVAWPVLHIADFIGPFLFVALVIGAFALSLLAPAHEARAQSVPTISCSTDANLFNTGFNPSTGGSLSTGQDRNWEVSTLQPAYYQGRLPPALSYRSATIVDSPSSVWTAKKKTSWISLSNTGHQGPPNEDDKRETYRDLFFRYQFKLDPQVDLNSIRLNMDFYADDGIYQVWVNKTPQGVRSKNITPDYARIPPSMYSDPSDDYYWANSYKAGNQEAGVLSSGFQTGLNEIVVQIKSQAEHVGLQAHFTGTLGICHPELTVKQKSSLVNTGRDAKPGDEISIQADITNTGRLDFSRVEASDSINSVALSPNKFALAKSAVVPVSGRYSITQDDIDRGYVDNNVTAKGTTSNSLSDTANDSKRINLSQRAEMTVDKKSDGDGSDFVAGGKLTYTVTVTNTGNVTLSRVTPSDPHLDAPLEPQGNFSGGLSPGESVVFKGAYTPNQAEIDTGSLTNIVTVRADTPPGAGDGGGSTISRKGQDTATLPGKAEMSVSKSADKPVDTNRNGVTDAGDTINYRIKVENTGNVTLSNVVVNDPLLDAGSLSPASVQRLDARKNITFTGRHTITQKEIDAGSLTNTAKVEARSPTNAVVSGRATNTVTFPDVSKIEIEKQAAYVAPASRSNFKLGDKLRYTVKVYNKGNKTLSDITVKDLLDGVILVASNPSITTLKPGEGATYTATYEPRQAEIDAGELVNKAEASALSSNGQRVSAPPASATTYFDTNGSLNVTKTATPRDDDGRFNPGDIIDYKVVVENESNVTIKDIRLEDSIPGLTLNASGGFNGTLAAGDSKTFTASYKVSASDIDSGSLTNKATAKGKLPDQTSIEGFDTATTEFGAFPGIGIKKEGVLNDANGNDAYDVGETIDYRITVKNTGNVTLTGILPDDTIVLDNNQEKKLSLQPDTPQTLAPDQSTVFTATYTVVQEDIDAGGMKNTASVTGQPPKPDQTPPEDSDEIRVAEANAKSEIVATRTASLLDDNKNQIGDEGENVQVSTTVTNTGTTTLYNVTLDEDRLSPEAKSTSGPTLKPDEEFEIKGSYALNSEEVQAGQSVTTVVPVGETANKEKVRGDEASAEVTWAKPSQLIVEKTGAFIDVNNDGFASDGDVIEYTITVTNDGGQNVVGVKPRDEGIVLPDKSRGTGTLGEFEPASADLGPQEAAVFKARYVLNREDLNRAAGVKDGIVNTATATGKAGTQEIPATPGTATTVLPLASPSDITIIKESLVSQIRRGEKAPFIITVINNTKSRIDNIAIVDTMPAGFRFDEDSASVNGEAAKPIVSGRNIRFDDVSVEPGAKTYVRLTMTALSTLSPGKYENQATASDHFGRPLSSKASASVTIQVDPIFDCSDVLGRVFDDVNGDGYVDDGEKGLPGVRVATAYGLLVTTDQYGRFHVACADLPDKNIGSNFIMKLDERTLPTGYHVTSENPRVVRLTAGKTVKLNFGASAGHMVEVDLTADAFEPDSIALKSEWQGGLDQLVAILGGEQSRLRLNYLTDGTEDLAGARLKAVAQQIEGLWKAQRRPGKPDISTRIEISE